MQNSIWKLTALAGVVGIGFLAVLQVQRGIDGSKPQEEQAATGEEFTPVPSAENGLTPEDAVSPHELAALQSEPPEQSELPADPVIQPVSAEQFEPITEQAEPLFEPTPTETTTAAESGGLDFSSDVVEPGPVIAADETDPFAAESPTDGPTFRAFDPTAAGSPAEIKESIDAAPKTYFPAGDTERIGFDGQPVIATDEEPTLSEPGRLEPSEPTLTESAEPQPLFTEPTGATTDVTSETDAAEAAEPVFSDPAPASQSETVLPELFLPEPAPTQPAESDERPFDAEVPAETEPLFEPLPTETPAEPSLTDAPDNIPTLEIPNSSAEPTFGPEPAIDSQPAAEPVFAPAPVTEQPQPDSNPFGDQPAPADKPETVFEPEPTFDPPPATEPTFDPAPFSDQPEPVTEPQPSFEPDPAFDPRPTTESAEPTLDPIPLDAEPQLPDQPMPTFEPDATFNSEPQLDSNPFGDQPEPAEKPEPTAPAVEGNPFDAAPESDPKPEFDASPVQPQTIRTPELESIPVEPTPSDPEPPVPAIDSPLSSPGELPTLEGTTIPLPADEGATQASSTTEIVDGTQLASDGPAQVTIEKIAPKVAVLGRPMIYSVIVSNVGEVDARSVVVKDQVPDGAQLTGTIPRCQLQDETLIWELGAIPAGATRKLSIRIVPTIAGHVGSIATVSFKSATIVPGEPAAPKLDVSVSARDKVTVGQDVVFRFQIKNFGETDAENVVVRDFVPAGMSHAGGRDLQYTIGTIPAGATENVQLTLKSTAVGRSTNRVVITGDGDIRESITKTVHVTPQSIAVSRTIPAQQPVGHPTDYTTTLTNTSQNAISGSVLVETLASGVDFVSATDGGQYNESRRAVAWKVDTLAPGESRSFSVRVILRKPVGTESTIKVYDAAGELLETAFAPNAVRGSETVAARGTR